ncbi:S8 family serine peptidase [Micromonospora sp. NPDC050187]|uniref:S8 family serine peptidase n=1 Tax=Micromonospora sp. NPDC050187 TaxID=3364277 RepID=UPI0037906B40
MRLSWGDAVKIWADGVRESELDTNVRMIGTPTAWAAGYDGTGVKVAVLDSGIDDNHPDLAGKASPACAAARRVGPRCRRCRAQDGALTWPS